MFRSDRELLTFALGAAFWNAVITLFDMSDQVARGAASDFMGSGVIAFAGVILGVVYWFWNRSE